MIVCLSLFVFVTAQIVTPALADLVKDLEQTGGKYTASMLADYWLRLSIANTYLWLLMFYFYFHLYLNFFAEILRFGDRVFYKGETMIHCHLLRVTAVKYTNSVVTWTKIGGTVQKSVPIGDFGTRQCTFG
jgi:hypothetical protein